MCYKEDLAKGKIERSNLEANKDFLIKTKIINQGMKILEIGCGAGSICAYLNSRGFNIIGTDVSKELLDYAKRNHKGCKFFKMSGDKLRFKDEYFDAVLSFDVLEHIPNVKKHLLEVKRVLRPNGHYLFQTPNKLTNLPYCIMKDRSFTKWKTYHSSLQTKKSLVKLFRENNFAIKFVKININNAFMKEKLFFPLNLINLNKLPIQTNFYVVAIKL
ncbi:TPA: class I SAM-dependent methyltransferase [Candidatus Woesearchaeota archaeon]|nr:class I SAM-dependent methyltransferase [Candidatus Woesearchaeota archaeon]HIH31555.1 class I SAM-dependent methyltransferase [Candidatus Woesearchaeota archaeon]HIH54287.1 class I SAM-dependent methyltransferase [Candidatus Woesearchaeota archaeon]HIJ02523.1 class I SAM-dependent methyltransferase [Candidatus Woesearchaeota archaeon]HIJ13431.1 class I SAM-dependent methyltransferase [Candidatus Woesearchaeota archaeon]